MNKIKDIMTEMREKVDNVVDHMMIWWKNLKITLKSKVSILRIQMITLQEKL